VPPPPTEKLEALTTMAPPMLKPGGFRTPDKLLAMLSAAKGKPRLLDRNVQSSKMVHAALLLLMLEAAITDLVSPSA
jgi:hypothetical protein